MDKEVSKKYAQKLIEQIGNLQSIDSEKHEYFSKKAMDALQEINNENYEGILGLESEMIDYLEDRVRTNQHENLPVDKQKSSLLSRIKEIFSRKSEESEISRIAQMVAGDDDRQEGEFNSDIRTPVYDFFRDEIVNNSNLQRWNTNYTISFANPEGHQRTFDIGIDQFGIGKIHIGESEITTYEKIVGDELYARVVRDGIGEYLDLIKYDQFINAKTGDKSFINEFGRLVTEMSRGYNSQSIDERNIAGKKLDKALLKNPIYMQMRKSFYRAYKEYIKTFAEFRENEANRKDDFNKRKSFIDGVSVNGIFQNNTTEQKSDSKDNQHITGEKDQESR